MNNMIILSSKNILISLSILYFHDKKKSYKNLTIFKIFYLDKKKFYSANVHVPFHLSYCSIR